MQACHQFYFELKILNTIDSLNLVKCKPNSLFNFDKVYVHKDHRFSAPKSIDSTKLFCQLYSTFFRSNRYCHEISSNIKKTAKVWSRFGENFGIFLLFLKSNSAKHKNFFMLGKISWQYQIERKSWIQLIQKFGWFWWVSVWKIYNLYVWCTEAKHKQS